jgi:CDP-diacylglycerol--serine O-phosphatidyltransferase
MSVIKQIPNTITLLNLLCGALAVTFAFEGHLQTGVYFVFAGLLFDFADGFVARLLKVSSPLGAELDSLADLVTFGLFPSVMVYQVLKADYCDGKCTGLVPSYLFPYLAFVIVIFSAYRLAKFNIDTEQTYNFKGVPTPINALVFCAVPFLLDDPLLGDYVSNPKVLIALAIVQSYLLVTDHPFLALKFKDYSIKKNWNKYLLLITSLFALILFQYAGIFVIYGVYVLLSLLTIRPEIKR